MFVLYSLPVWSGLATDHANTREQLGLIGKLQQHFIILLLLSPCYMASLYSDKTIMDTQAPLAKRQKMNGNGYGLDVGVNYGEGSVSLLIF